VFLGGCYKNEGAQTAPKRPFWPPKSRHLAMKKTANTPMFCWDPQQNGKMQILQLFQIFQAL